MKLITYFFLVSILLCISCKKNNTENLKDNITLIQGTVADKDEKKLYLISGTEFMKILDTIFVTDGSFKHELVSEEAKAYQLVSAKQFDKTNTYLLFPIFSEKGELNIHFDIADDAKNSKVKGGVLNTEYQKYKNTIDKPHYKEIDNIYNKYSKLPEDSLYSKEANVLRKKIRKALSVDKKTYLELAKKRENMMNEKQFYSFLGNQRELLLDDKIKQYRKIKSDYIDKNPTLASYFLFTEDLVMNEEIPNALEKFNVFKEKFPSHSYTKLCENLIKARNNIKVGGKYINFTASDINNKPVALKSVLENSKVVLLNLWATWCGPCIIKTKKMIPIYDKYKDKGFTILGVAGEHKNLDAFKKFMDKEKWEWQQLIELDRQNKIWEKYNVMNSAGAMFLIDTSGEILAVNPTPEEVEKILLEKL